jgi:hypothetical protein
MATPWARLARGLIALLHASRLFGATGVEAQSEIETGQLVTTDFRSR